MFHVICLLAFTLIALALALCAIWFGVGVTLCAYVLVACVALYKLNPRR